MRKFDFVEKAVKSLYPEVESLSFDGSVDEVTDTVPLIEINQQAVRSEVARLMLLADALVYQNKRAAEYPPITDYLDGVVKGDQAQVDAYIAACQAVKAKYPKPESV